MSPLEHDPAPVPFSESACLRIAIAWLSTAAAGYAFALIGLLW